jgi:hypothetical protein
MKGQNWIVPLAAAAAVTLFACRLGQNPASYDGENMPDATETPEVLFTLYQNAPNPFQHSTLIRFRLEKKLAVHLRVGGRTVLNEVREGPAVHYLVYEAPAEFPNGEYLYTMEASGRIQARSMQLLR